MALCTLMRVDHVSKFDDAAVIGAFDDPAMVERDGRVNEVAGKRSQARENALLVRTGEPAIADYVSDQDRRYLALAMFRRHFGSPANDGQS
jgi:hypothetical protein